MAQLSTYSPNLPLEGWGYPTGLDAQRVILRRNPPPVTEDSDEPVDFIPAPQLRENVRAFLELCGAQDCSSPFEAIRRNYATLQDWCKFIGTRRPAWKL